MKNLLKISKLRKFFLESRVFSKLKRAAVAVDGVDLTIPAGASVGVVGESGCGKSTLMRCIVGLESLDAGSIEFNGRDIQHISKNDLKRVRSQIQLIFQDPRSALNPRHSLHNIIAEPLIVHRKMRKADIDKAVNEMIEQIGMSNNCATLFPHQLSGGQQQRVCIARALILEPSLIIADEPTSALDVSVQAQILNLLRELKAKFNLTILFISHNLAVVRNICDQVGIMYLGQIVEFGLAKDIFKEPFHPYTQMLLSAIPKVQLVSKKQYDMIPSDVGDVPSAFNIPKGCRFHTRCPKVMDICKNKDPKVIPIHKYGYVACYLYS
jgi:oligopeptide/dipeptide ABC transporter ATP-binding protein